MGKKLYFWWGGGIGCLFEGTSVVRKNFQPSEGLAVLSPEICYRGDTISAAGGAGEYGN